MARRVGAYCLARTTPVRRPRIASNPCTHAGSLILMGKFFDLQRLIDDLLMDKCWHNFCLVAYAFVARPVGVADTPFSLGDTNGKDRRRCNADAEGQRSKVR
jgi:hypothetical protein